MAERAGQEDVQARRTVLRWFTYGLYAVTVAHEGDAGAFTANWLGQASFDPPMLMVSVEADSHSLPLIRAAGRFAVNVFATGQRELAGQLGRKTRHVGDKLATVAHHVEPSGLPVLDEALGYLTAEVTGEVVAGDSVVIVARVVEAVVQREGTPLTMAEAGFRHAG
ncbi:MAG TPA: flavin reductase family protein [Thermomicrobiaceae bacterium]|nr:flavin reductase family protein [Thermomicrobiaceae bacterium]